MPKLHEYAIHVFSERTDLTLASYHRELKRQQKEREFYKVFSEEFFNGREINQAYQDMLQETHLAPIPAETIIEYPHAVSNFIHHNNVLAAQYTVQYLSKRRKAPVLVSNVGKLSEPGIPEEQALCLYFGFENKCISQIEIESAGQSVTVKSKGINELRTQLGFLLPDNSILFSPLDGKTPFEIIPKLSEELGIFLGDTQLEEYLNRCTLKKSIETWRFFKSERFQL